VTNHAVEQYWKRVRPSLDLQQAELELLHILPTVGTWTTERPEWVDSEGADRFLLLGDDVCFPMVLETVRETQKEIWVATTCIPRGILSYAERRERNRAHRFRRHEAATSKQRERQAAKHRRQNDGLR
jgi:hypothetical protein